MKKLWIYGALLAVLTAACVTGSVYMERVNLSAASLVENASRQLKLGDLEGADATFSTAYEDWQRQSPVLHALVRHDILDETRESFARADAYIEQGARGDFIAESAALVELLRSLAESDSASCLNIF